MKKSLVLVVCILVIAVVGVYKIIDNNIFPENQFVNKDAVYYVTVDINPSIELALDENDIVVDAIPLNDDAIITYDGLNVIGDNLDVATDKMLAEVIEVGYINDVNEDNAIVLTIYTDSDEDITDLTTSVKNAINQNLTNKNINAVIYTNGVTDEIKEKALEYEISFGKMMLVQRAMTLDATLNENELVDMSIKDIQSKIHEKASQNREELRNMYKEQRQELKQIKNDKMLQFRAKIEAKKQELLGENSKNEKRTEELEQKKEEIKNIIQERKMQVEKNEEQNNRELQQLIQQRKGQNNTGEGKNK